MFCDRTLILRSALPFAVWESNFQKIIIIFDKNNYYYNLVFKRYINI